MKKLLFCLSLTTFLVSCDSEMDDQRIIKPSQYSVVNPTPHDRDFIKNNENHKVIVAIMDTGIDYNHPYLANNIHFDLDENGQPTGAGWDYGGEDSWPAPYIARTDFFNLDLDSGFRTTSLEMFNYSKELIKEYPALKTLLPLERNIEEEAQEHISHGTHVAGLASYDSPEIGLRGYRVLPINKVKAGAEGDLNNLQVVRFAKVLMDSLSKAVSDGAKVINMSLGTNYTKDTQEDMREFYQDFQKQLITFAENNPEVMLVVAAGNDGKWIDGSSVTGLPCFIPSKNVICVSALSKDMTPASFTNIVLSNEVTTIFAWGEKILSTMPTKTCHDKKLKYENVSTAKGRSAINEVMQNECKEDQYLQEMSGTSMASPVVARKVAKIIAQNPNLSVGEIKKILFEGSLATDFGKLSVTKLPIEIPSWYQSHNKSINGKKWNLSLFTK